MGLVPLGVILIHSETQRDPFPVLHLVIFRFPSGLCTSPLMCFVFQQSHHMLCIPVSKLHGWIYRWPNCEACLSEEKRHCGFFFFEGRRGGGEASGHNLEISFDIVLAFATRLAPTEVLMCLLQWSHISGNNVTFFILGFFCPGCHDIRYRHGFCNKSILPSSGVDMTATEKYLF